MFSKLYLVYVTSKEDAISCFSCSTTTGHVYFLGWNLTCVIRWLYHCAVICISILFRDLGMKEEAFANL